MGGLSRFLLARFLLATALPLVCPLAAHANEPVIYEPAFFEQFAPQTANDMVARIPGFTIRGGEGGERGFGQASLNILVNGRRPSSKSLGASGILERISADSVVRIEVVDGTTLDIPGLSGDVANIIQEAFGFSGRWELGARFEEGTEPQWPEVEATATLTRGDVSVTGALDLGQFTFTENGEERFFTPDGVLFEDRREDLVYESQRPNLNASLSWTPPSGSVLNVNGEVQTRNENFDIREMFAAVGEGGTDGQSLFFSGEDELEWELGGDYSQDFGLGRLKLIGLYGFENSEFTTRFADFTDGRDPSAQEFLQDIEETEIIGRAEYTLSGGAWQVSAEYAYNELIADSEADGAAQPLVEVNEDRVQGSVSHNRKLGEWDVQAVAGVEYSKITVPTNPSAEARTFYRPKGTLSASRDLDDRHSLVLKAERKVGQLDFFDFVSDVDLEEGRDDRGNVGIVPDQEWSFEGTLERTDPTFLSWTLTPRVGITDDPFEQIRFADGSEGPGNLDSRAYFYGAEGNFTLVMDRWVKGMRLEGSGRLFETDIEDPLTTERRRLSGATLWLIDLQLRHDVPDTQWAYQFDLRRLQTPIRSFRFDEQSALEYEAFPFRAELEYKDFFGMNLRFVGQNIFNETKSRTRDLFVGDRFGAPVRTEIRDRQRGPRFSILLSDTF